MKTLVVLTVFGFVLATGFKIPFGNLFRSEGVISRDELRGRYDDPEPGETER